MIRKFLKISISFFLIALLLEVISRNFLTILPLEVHRRYSNADKIESDKKYNINGRGARGEWPDSNKLQIAMFGSSILGAYGFPSEQTWPELIKPFMYYPTHVDNYGAGYTKYPLVVEMLKNIKSQNIKYDIIIIQLAGDWRNNKREEYLSLSFMSRWIIPPHIKCGFCYLFLNYIERNNYLSNFREFFSDEVSSQANSKIKNNVHLKSPEYIIDNILYKKIIAENKFATGIWYIPEDKIRAAGKMTLEAYNLAKTIAPHVIFVRENIAFHPQMKATHRERFANLIQKLPRRSPPVYLDEESRYKFYESCNQNVRDIVSGMEITEMEWLNPLLARLPQEDDLFLDDFHLSKKGHQEVAIIMAHQLNDFIAKNIKTENK